MLIYIIRHGETQSNVEGRLQGWSNDGLNENGKKLAEITGRRLKNIHFDYCISSPLARAKETAETILQTFRNPVVISFDDRIKEINMGDWEGKKFRPGEREVDAEQIKLFFTDPFSFGGYPNGENAFHVCNRTQCFLKELIARDDDKTYLVSTHGFALRAMLNYLYDNPRDFWHGHVPYNCVVNIVEGKNGIGRLIADDIIYYNANDAVDQYSIF